MPTQPSASEALTPAFYTWAGLLPWLLGLWIGLLVGLPWLGPWSVSPQPNTLPLLLSWACTGLLLLCAARIKPLDVARAWAWAALISSALGLIQYFGAASVLSPWLHVPQALGEASAMLVERPAAHVESQAPDLQPERGNARTPRVAVDEQPLQHVLLVVVLRMEAAAG